MFNVRDKVVYPGHGVAVIEEVLEKKVADTDIQFFKLNFLYKDMTILVPLKSMLTSGVRFLSALEEIERVMEELTRLPEKKLESIDFTPSAWNKRHKDYVLRIQSGKLMEIAKIYRDLMHVGKQKELSFGEKSLLATTEDLMAQELIVIRNQDREAILQELRTPFKAFMPMGGAQVSTTSTVA